MVTSISKIGLRLLLVCIIACLCLVPTTPLPDETTDFSSTAKYLAPHPGAIHWSNYRQHVSHKFLEHKLYIYFWKDTSRKLLFALPLLIVPFLFIIQTRLKWILLMPIKYRSEFVIFLLEGNIFIPERGNRYDVHETGTRNDSTDNQRFETVCLFFAADRNRAGRRKLCNRIDLRMIMAGRTRRSVLACHFT